MSHSPYPQMLYRPDGEDEITNGVTGAMLVVADADEHGAASKDGWLTADEFFKADAPAKPARKTAKEA